VLGNNEPEKGPMGFLIQASCEAMCLKARWLGNLFEIPKACDALITESWIKNVWRACHCYMITIKCTTHDFEWKHAEDRDYVHYGLTRVCSQ